MATQDIKTTIYNGKHTVDFRSKAHRYYIDGRPIMGVTTVLGKVLAKPQLMLWPLNMAMAYMRNNLVPFTDYSAEWIELTLEKAYKAHLVKRDHGSDTGTEAHGMVEEYLGGMQPGSGHSQEAQNAFNAFQGWFEKVRPQVVGVEQVVYSEKLGYAGTFDSILEIDGKVYLVDLKTTNSSRIAPSGVYPENFFQLGAYAHAYEEQRLYERENGGTMLRAIDDVMIVSAKKDGHLDTKTGADLGMTVMECARLWEYTLFLHNNLAQLGQKLQGGKI